jgi:hypothetical protein
MVWTTVVTQGKKYAARLWYDGQLVNVAKDAAQVALMRYNQIPRNGNRRIVTFAATSDPTVQIVINITPADIVQRPAPAARPLAHLQLLLHINRYGAVLHFPHHLNLGSPMGGLAVQFESIAGSRAAASLLKGRDRQVSVPVFEVVQLCVV